MDIVVTNYLNETVPPPIGIPTEQYEISEQLINNTLISVMKEDEQYTATFIIDKTQYIIYAEHLDYDECQKVLDSFYE